MFRFVTKKKEFYFNFLLEIEIDLRKLCDAVGKFEAESSKFSNQKIKMLVLSKLIVRLY